VLGYVYGAEAWPIGIHVTVRIYLLEYFRYFEKKNKVGLCDFHAGCVPVFPLY
jgi:hypothetical protein